MEDGAKTSKKKKSAERDAATAALISDFFEWGVFLMAIVLGIPVAALAVVVWAFTSYDYSEALTNTAGFVGGLFALATLPVWFPLLLVYICLAGGSCSKKVESEPDGPGGGAAASAAPQTSRPSALSVGDLSLAVESVATAPSGAGGTSASPAAVIQRSQSDSKAGAPTTSTGSAPKRSMSYAVQLIELGKKTDSGRTVIAEGLQKGMKAVLRKSASKIIYVEVD
eukprot:g7352.t1